MKITILTLFPELFTNTLNYSILKRARKKKLAEFEIVNIRDFSGDKHKSVDDHPYGGGVGMILRVDVVEKAITSVRIKPRAGGRNSRFKEKVVLLDPRGKTFNQKTARLYSSFDHLVLVCGHYEGIDDRVRSFVDEEISIGDFILTGGEIPANLVIDATVRLIPGVLKRGEATLDESFMNSILTYPQYTRPRIYKKLKVPPILLSGDHQKIKAWQKQQALSETTRSRPDLIPLLL